MCRHVVGIPRIITVSVQKLWLGVMYNMVVMSVTLSRVTVNGRLLPSCLNNCNLCFFFFACLLIVQTHKNTPIVIVNTYFINEYISKISYLLEQCLRVMKSEEYIVKITTDEVNVTFFSMTIRRSRRKQFVDTSHFFFFFVIYICFYSYTRQLQEMD